MWTARQWNALDQFSDCLMAWRSERFLLMAACFMAATFRVSMLLSETVALLLIALAGTLCVPVRQSCCTELRLASGQDGMNSKERCLQLPSDFCSQPSCCNTALCQFCLQLAWKERATDVISVERCDLQRFCITGNGETYTRPAQTAIADSLMILRGADVV
jgi:hypothetical protein